MSQRLRTILIAAPVAAVVAVAGAFAFFSLSGDDAPPPPSLSNAADGATTGTTAAPSTTADAPAADGALSVVPSDDTFVGYRVGEEFIGVGTKEAVGRTGDVTGTVTVEGEQIASAELTADMSTVTSDETRRDNALRDRGIETSRFPEATFRLTEPVALSDTAQTATGELTLHGVTKTVDAKLTSQRTSDGTVEVAGSAPIVFADFEIEPPSIGGFVTVEDKGELEFQLSLAA